MNINQDFFNEDNNDKLKQKYESKNNLNDFLKKDEFFIWQGEPAKYKHAMRSLKKDKSEQYTEVGKSGGVITYSFSFAPGIILFIFGIGCFVAFLSMAYTNSLTQIIFPIFAVVFLVCLSIPLLRRIVKFSKRVKEVSNIIYLFTNQRFLLIAKDSDRYELRVSFNLNKLKYSSIITKFNDGYGYIVIVNSSRDFVTLACIENCEFINKKVNDIIDMAKEDNKINTKSIFDLF